jgi:hypothetical protein
MLTKANCLETLTIDFLYGHCLRSLTQPIECLKMGQQSACEKYSSHGSKNYRYPC